MNEHHSDLGSTEAVRQLIGQDIYLPGQDIYLISQDIYLLDPDVNLLGQDIYLLCQGVYLLGQNIYLLGQDIYLLGQHNFLLGQDTLVKVSPYASYRSCPGLHGAQLAMQPRICVYITPWVALYSTS